MDRRQFLFTLAATVPALTLGVWMNGDGTYRAVEGAGVREPLDARATLNLEPAA